MYAIKKDSILCSVSEQFLRFCLLIESDDTIKQEIRDEAIHYIGVYILNNFIKKGRDCFEEAEFAEQFEKLISEFILEQLVKKGVLETDLTGDEVQYKLTDIGVGVANKLKNSD